MLETLRPTIQLQYDGEGWHSSSGAFDAWHEDLEKSCELLCGKLLMEQRVFKVLSGLSPEEYADFIRSFKMEDGICSKDNKTSIASTNWGAFILWCDTYYV